VRPPYSKAVVEIQDNLLLSLANDFYLNQVSLLTSLVSKSVLWLGSYLTFVLHLAVDLRNF